MRFSFFTSFSIVVEVSGGIAQLLKQSGLTSSTSEALRMIEQGGIRIDGERCSDKALTLPAASTVVLQVGKRKFARVTVA